MFNLETVRPATRVGLFLCLLTPFGENLAIWRDYTPEICVGDFFTIVMTTKCCNTCFFSHNRGIHVVDIRTVSFHSKPSKL